MIFIAHRRNTLEELNTTPVEYGIEVDIRSRGENLIIHHDALVPGGDFLEWIAAYRHGTLILNVKEEGLEARLLSVMDSHGITDFFFLDQSFPFLVKWAKAGEQRCAVRVSGIRIHRYRAQSRGQSRLGLGGLLHALSVERGRGAPPARRRFPPLHRFARVAGTQC